MFTTLLLTVLTSLLSFYEKKDFFRFEIAVDRRGNLKFSSVVSKLIHAIFSLERQETMMFIHRLSLDSSKVFYQGKKALPCFTVHRPPRAWAGA